MLKSLPTSLLQREETRVSPFEKGGLRGIKGDFTVILCTSWNLELFFHKAKFG